LSACECLPESEHIAFAVAHCELLHRVRVLDDRSIDDVRAVRLQFRVQGARIAGMNQMIPLGRGGFPEEAAGAIYLFCSPDSDFVSGQTLVVTGGA